MNSKKETLKLDKIINTLSILYRKELKKNNKIREDLRQMQQTIFEESLSRYENIAREEFLNMM